MFELIWAIWAIPKFIHPVAKANGRNGLRWTIYAIGIFLSVETMIVVSYLLIYFSMSEKYKLPKHPEYFGWTYVVYVIALFSGFLSVDFIRRYLSKKEEVYKKIQHL